MLGYGQFTLTHLEHEPCSTGFQAGSTGWSPKTKRTEKRRVWSPRGLQRVTRPHPPTAPWPSAPFCTASPSGARSEPPLGLCSCEGTGHRRGRAARRLGVNSGAMTRETPGAADARLLEITHPAAGAEGKGAPGSEAGLGRGTQLPLPPPEHLAGPWTGFLAFHSAAFPKAPRTARVLASVPVEWEPSRPRLPPPKRRLPGRAWPYGVQVAAAGRSRPPRLEDSPLSTGSFATLYVREWNDF